MSSWNSIMHITTLAIPWPGTTAPATLNRIGSAKKTPFPQKPIEEGVQLWAAERNAETKEQLGKRLNLIKLCATRTSNTNEMRYIYLGHIINFEVVNGNRDSSSRLSRNPAVAL